MGEDKIILEPNQKIYCKAVDKDRYEIFEYINSGSFGSVMKARDIHLRQDVLLKIEKSSVKKPQLKHEQRVYQMFQNESEHFPYFYRYMHEQGPFKYSNGDCNEFSTDYFNVLILELLGRDLGECYQFTKEIYRQRDKDQFGKKNLSVSTIIDLGKQMFSALQFLHEKSYIHRDIKPENFMFGRGPNSSILHLLDFGLAKKYMKRGQTEHIKDGFATHNVGTKRYMSVSVIEGNVPCRKDDCISVLYVLSQLYQGDLPWSSHKFKKEKNLDPAHEKKLLHEFHRKKRREAGSLLFRGIDDLNEVMQICNETKFHEAPDYNKIEQIFDKMAVENFMTYTPGHYEWTEFYDQFVDRKDPEGLRHIVKTILQDNIRD